MAGAGDCFTIGSVVSCKTLHSKDIEGEVLAFDPQTKMLILKCPASNGRTTLNDVYVINLSMVSSVVVKTEEAAAPITPVTLNLDKLNTRLRNQLEEKKRIVTAYNAGVSPEGQQLFLAISKTISEVCWRGDDIVVWGSVTISPPYKAENLRGDADKALHQVKKIVEKHIKDSLCQQGTKN